MKKTIKRFIKFLIPKKYLYIFFAIREYYYDVQRYTIHSNTYYKLDSEFKFEGYFILKYHVIEKGLTMPKTRLGFGSIIIEDIIEKCNLYIEKNYKLESESFIHAVKVLNEYILFHEKASYKLDDRIVSEIKQLANLTKILSVSHQIEVERKNYFKESNSSFSEFCLSRSSVRDFIPGEIPKSVLMNCIKLANKSPSACNRQPNRVYVLSQNDIIQKALSLQNGNRGFGQLIPCLLVITSDVSVFQSAAERNEPALNAGLFSMTLTYALHHYQLGACMLNWSSSKQNDKQLRELLHIPDNEMVAVMIACGNMPEKFKVAESPRINSSSVTQYVNFS